jgi:hypothetical protein
MAVTAAPQAWTLFTLMHAIPCQKTAWMVRRRTLISDCSVAMLLSWVGVCLRAADATEPPRAHVAQGQAGCHGGRHTRTTSTTTRTAPR